MKSFEQKEGFLNRHINGLPDSICQIWILKDNEVYLCTWFPFDESEYSEKTMPPKEYLGTAEVIEGEYKGIGFHAWKHDDIEFVWYAVV